MDQGNLPAPWARVARWVGLLLHLGVAISFLVAWLAPEVLGLDRVVDLIFVVTFEIMAAFLVAMVWGLFDPDRWDRVKAALGLVFWVLGFGVMLTLVATQAGRLHLVLVGVAQLALHWGPLVPRLVRRGHQAEIPARRWVAVGAVFLAALVPAWLPTPALGLASVDLAAATGGIDPPLFAQAPQEAMAWGLAYFLILALADAALLWHAGRKRGRGTGKREEAAAPGSGTAQG